MKCIAKISGFGLAVTTGFLLFTHSCWANHGALIYTSPATSVTESSAQLNGSIFVGFSPTYTLGFLFGQSNPPVDTLPASPTSVSSAQQGQTIPFSHEVTGLACNTTYYFRSLMDFGGVEYGTVESFQTLPCTVPALSELGQLLLAFSLVPILVYSGQKRRVRR